MVVGLAAGAMLVGVVLWALSNRWIGATLIISGIIAFVWLVTRSGETRRIRALEEVRVTEAQVVSQSQAEKDARRQVQVARTRTIELGLPTNAKALRELADALVMKERNQQILEEWSRNNEELISDVSTKREVLEQALKQRGIADVADVLAAYEEYERTCKLRGEQAARASRRPSLVQQLSDREAAEQAVCAAKARRLGARKGIFTTLAHCGLEASDEVTAVAELRGWQTRHQELLMSFDDATREYAELEACLAGGTLSDLDARSRAFKERVAAMEADLGELPELSADLNLDEQVRRAGNAARNAMRLATEAEMHARERAKDVPSLVGAEKSLAAAQKESERVAQLGATLTLTLGFLRRAEERVHRSIAPILAAGLRRWLAEVTQERYTDARVDPGDLRVQVLAQDGRWYDADRLSHGTAEQIYLLLRVVLAEVLVTSGETCPLLLDDVLVQSDCVRKRSLLNVISAISRVRQVILLTQEEEVLRWAQQRIAEPDRLILLPGTS